MTPTACRYVAVKDDKTQEMDATQAMISLLEEDADFVIRACANIGGEVMLTKLTLKKEAP